MKINANETIEELIASNAETLELQPIETPDYSY
jgi:hypothetical protein